MSLKHQSMNVHGSVTHGGRRGQITYPLTDDRHTTGSLLTVECDSVTRSEALTPATAWMKLEHVMLSERNRSSKDT